MLKPEPSDRSFGLLATAVFLAIGLQPMLHGVSPRAWSLIGAADLLLLTLVFPRSLRLLKRAWLSLGSLLSRVVNPVVLAALFYFVITPAAWLMRCFGADPLRLKYSPTLATYWQPRTNSESTFADQF